MKTIMVFGATGTVGAYTCLYLVEHGYNVVAVGHRKSDNGFFHDYGMKYISVDISNPFDFENLPCENIYAVINLAGLLPARMKGYQPQKYIDINITGCLNIWNYCAKVGVSKVIYSQSISDVAYLCGDNKPISSDAESKFPLDNDHTVYSISKNAATSLLEHFATHYNFYYYVLRFPNIYLYHPNPMYYVDGEEKWQGYRLMIHKAILGEPIQIWGDPSKVRDIVYVKDCTQIIERCIGVENAPSGKYNVGTGIGVSLEDQVKGIVEIFSPKNNPSPITYEPNMPDASEYIFDISKTQRELGYMPQYEYKEYLKDFKKEKEAQRFVKLWGCEKIN